MIVGLVLVLLKLATIAYSMDMVPADWPVLRFEDGFSMGLGAAAGVVAIGGILQAAVQ